MAFGLQVEINVSGAISAGLSVVVMPCSKGEILRLSALLLLVALVIGCEGTNRTEPRATGNAENAGPASSPPYATHPQGHPIVLSRGTFDATISDVDRPKTAEALVAEFERRFKSSPEDAFVELTYWGNAPQEVRYAIVHEFVGSSAEFVGSC